MNHSVLSRILSLIIVLALLVTLLVPFAVAKTGTLEVNRAKRHSLCTELSAQALDYYTGDFSYENLSTLSGVYAPADSWQATQDNELFSALQSLMTDTHTNQNVVYSGYSENALATYWAATDAAEGTYSYLYFYTDIDAAEGYTMNREHVWPKSKASYYQRGGGADLHHLRPSISTVNSAKSNHTFGDLNGTGSASRIDGRDIIWTGGGKLEVQDNVKGDVARILLYVYCRWGQPNLYSDVKSANLPPLDPDDDANSGVRAVESLDTLLEWMLIDPVDAWEMERNDQIENVQGNRNVFIDYPELAWLMFDLDLPSDYPTPSGEAIIGAHNWNDGVQISAPSCLEKGVMRFTCLDCGFTRDRSIPALGHDTSEVIVQQDATCTEDGYSVFVCSRCGQSLTQTLPALGHDYEGGTCIRCGQSVAMYTLTNELHDGDLVILYTPSANAAVSSEIRNDVYRGYESVTPVDGVIYTDSTAIVWSVEKQKNGFLLTDVEGNVLATGEQNSLPIDGRYNTWYTKEAETEGCIYLYNNGEKYLEWTPNYSDYAAFAYSPTYEAGLATQIYTQSVCRHAHTELRDLSPTCIVDGYEDAEFCVDCGARISLGTVLPANGHRFGEWQLFDAPDCTRNGTECRECLVCGYSETNTISALGHHYQAKITAATCTADGCTVYTCSRCNASYTETVRALGHDWSEWTVIAAACTEDGQQQRICGRCGSIETDVLPAFCASSEFTDVPTPEVWSHKGIDFCIDRNIMGSTSTQELLFCPDGTATRSMIVSVLYRLSGSPQAEYRDVFPDVAADAWYADAVLWAYDFGVVSGYNTGLFGPNDLITREQMAVILKGYTEKVVCRDTNTRAELDDFADAELVTWSADAVQWAVAEGLISGRVSDEITRLDPQGSASRAEVASILMRYCKVYVE